CLTDWPFREVPLLLPSPLRRACASIVRPGRPRWGTANGRGELLTRTVALPSHERLHRARTRIYRVRNDRRGRVWIVTTRGLRILLPICKTSRGRPWGPAFTRTTARPRRRLVTLNVAVTSVRPSRALTITLVPAGRRP